MEILGENRVGRFVFAGKENVNIDDDDDELDCLCKWIEQRFVYKNVLVLTSGQVFIFQFIVHC